MTAVDGLDFSGLGLGAALAVFGAAAVVVLVCGVLLTRLADRFADQSGFGEAVTGAVFLGALTSLSGSVTSITAAAEGHAALAIANALGGIAAQTVFLVAADFAYRRANLEHAAASLPNLITGTTLILLLGMVLMASSMPPVTVLGVHPVTLALLLVYGAGVRAAQQSRDVPMWQPQQTEETREDVPEEPRSDARTVARSAIILLALGIIVGLAGYVIAETGLVIAEKGGLRHGLVGALLTATATSTPELVTTVAAVRRGALTLAVSGILGGNAFDVLFAAFSDVAYRAGSVYHAIAPDQIFLVILSIVMTAIILLGMLRRQRFGPANIGFESVTLILLYGGGVAALIWAF